MDSAQLDHYRTRLQDKRNELTTRVRSARDSEAEPTDSDAPDLGDRALSTMTRDLQYQLSTTEREALRRVDRALERIGSGEFGTCDHCGKEVQPGRLDAVPWALHCIQCQELQDRGEI